VAAGRLVIAEIYVELRNLCLKEQNRWGDVRDGSPDHRAVVLSAGGPQNLRATCSILPKERKAGFLRESKGARVRVKVTVEEEFGEKGFSLGHVCSKRIQERKKHYIGNSAGEKTENGWA